MYVCLCNGLSDRDIRRAAEQGHCSVKGAYAALDAEVNCGRCVPFAHEMITEQRSRCNAVPAEAAE